MVSVIFMFSLFHTKSDWFLPIYTEWIHQLLGSNNQEFIRRFTDHTWVLKLNSKLYLLSSHSPISGDCGCVSELHYLLIFTKFLSGASAKFNGVLFRGWSLRLGGNFKGSYWKNTAEAEKVKTFRRADLCAQKLSGLECAFLLSMLTEK